VTQSRLGGFNGCTISRNTGSASQRAVCALRAGQRAASNNCGWASRVNRSAQATAMSAWPIFSPNQRVGLSPSRNPSFRKLGFTGIASLHPSYGLLPNRKRRAFARRFVLMDCRIKSGNDDLND
jgi:hypothetical protein